jgi:putative ABC transport system permease protein
MYSFKILTEHRIRFILTALGVSLCALLMLFLISVYRGVYFGSMEYVRSSKADLWVLQEHATNILRSTSFLPAIYEEEIEDIEGIRSAAPVLFILAQIKVHGTNGTLYLTGFDLSKGEGGPPIIIKGHNITSDNEIVVDKAFAAKYKVSPGDKIQIRDDSLVVSGISTGTNMFVIQYAFITLDEAYKIIGFRNVVSCYQVSINRDADIGKTENAICSKLDNIIIFRKEPFVNNNVREMESGILPLLFTVTVISAIVLTAIISLILSVTVIEKRRDFAIMKALGSPAGYVTLMVIRLSFILSSAGLILAMILFFPMVEVIERISPEVSARTSAAQFLLVAAGVTVISLISSAIPVRRLRKIYPLEVFM